MASPKTDPARAYLAAVRAHRATLDRLLDRRGLVPLKRLYDQQQDQLERELLQLLSARRARALDPLQAQVLTQKVRVAQQRMAVKLAKQMQVVLREAQTEGVRQTARTVARLELEFVGGIYEPDLDEPAITSRLVERRSGMLNSAAATAWERTAAVVSERMTEEVALALAEDEDAVATVERLRQKADDLWWMGARIVHTATAKAYNSAQADSIDEVAAAVPVVQKRWCELVDDFTGLPFDERVGQDSIVLHGQVVDRKGLFVMPPDLRVHPSMWGQTYFSSPNRPNDRSVTMPWVPGRGIPGWEWRGGSRVELPYR